MSDKVRDIVARLKERPMPPLVPKRPWDREVDAEIERALPSQGSAELRSVKSALFLWNDNLAR